MFQNYPTNAVAYADKTDSYSANPENSTKAFLPVSQKTVSLLTPVLSSG